MSDSLQSHGLQHARLPCPLLSPGVCSNSCPQPVMPSNHLILCCPLLLLPSIFPSIRVFSNKSALHIRWPKYWSFSFSISPSNEYSAWFPLRWTDLVSFLSKGFSRIFSSYYIYIYIYIYIYVYIYIFKIQVTLTLRIDQWKESSHLLSRLLLRISMWHNTLSLLKTSLSVIRITGYLYFHGTENCITNQVSLFG